MRPAMAFKLMMALVGSGSLACSSPAWAEGDTWLGAESMPTARRLLAAAAQGGKIYTFGGCGSVCFHPLLHPSTFEETRVEVYNPQEDRWDVKKPIPDILFGAAAAAPGNGKIYIFGGFVTANVTLEYDPKNDSWVKKAPMPTPRYGLAAVALGGEIYVLGGNGPSNVVEIYNPKNDTWRPGAPMPTARVFLAAAEADGKIYAIGGSPDCCGHAVTNAVEVYDPDPDPARDTWTRATPLPVAQQTSAAQVVNEKLYVFGGFIPGSGVLGTTYEYTPATKSWVSRAPLLTPRDQAPAVFVQVEKNGEKEDKIFLLGGSNDCHCRALAQNESYTPPGILSIEKTDNRETVCAGQTVRYDITVHNEGPDPLEGAELVDKLLEPNQNLSLRWCKRIDGAPCTPSNPGTEGFTTPLDLLAAGTEAKYRVDIDVPPGASGKLINEASVRLVGSEIDLAPPSTDTDMILQGGSLRVEVTAPDSIVQGEDLKATVTVVNDGPAAVSRVHLDLDTRPGLSPRTPAPKGCHVLGNRFSCDLGPLAAGEPLELPFAFQVPACYCSPGPIRTIATVDAPGPCNPDASDDAEASTIITGGEADLKLDEVFLGDEPLTPESDAPLELTVTNLGPQCSCGSTIFAPVPPGLVFKSKSKSEMDCQPVSGVVRCTVDKLEDGQSSSRKVTYSVPEDFPCPAVVTSPAEVRPHPFTPDFDSLDGNNTTAVDLDVVCDCGVDLSIEKLGPETAAPGETILYYLTVSNAGPLAATAAVTDTFPPELEHRRWCLVGLPCSPQGDLEPVLLSPGAEATYAVSGTVSAMFNGTLTNSASVAAAAPPGIIDCNPENNHDSHDVEVLCPPGVTAICKEIAGFLVEGGTVTYTYVLCNGGPATQMDNPGDEFTDVLPGTLTLIAGSADADSGAAATLGNTVTWNGPIAVQGIVTVTFSAKINPGTAGMTICNQGLVSFDANGDGVNETNRLSDDPGLPGPADPCCFVVPTEIPVLSGPGLAILLLLLGLLAVRRLVRLSPPPA